MQRAARRLTRCPLSVARHRGRYQCTNQSIGPLIITGRIPARSRPPHAAAPPTRGDCLGDSALTAHRFPTTDRSTSKHGRVLSYRRCALGNAAWRHFIALPAKAPLPEHTGPRQGRRIRQLILCKIPEEHVGVIKDGAISALPWSGRTLYEPSGVAFPSKNNE